MWIRAGSTNGSARTNDFTANSENLHLCIFSYADFFFFSRKFSIMLCKYLRFYPVVWASHRIAPLRLCSLDFSRWMRTLANSIFKCQSHEVRHIFADDRMVLKLSEQQKKNVWVVPDLQNCPFFSFFFSRYAKHIWQSEDRTTQNVHEIIKSVNDHFLDILLDAWRCISFLIMCTLGRRPTMAFPYNYCRKSFEVK